MREPGKARPRRMPGGTYTAPSRHDWVPLLLPLLWLVWLAALGVPLSSLLANPGAPARLGAVLVGAAAFVVLYLWTAWHNALRRPAPPARSWPIATLTALSVALTL